MVLQLTSPLDTSKSRKTGHFKSKTSRGLTSDLVPKSGLTEEDIRRGVWEELKLVKSDLKKVRKEQKLLKSHLADLVGRSFCLSWLLCREIFSGTSSRYMSRSGSWIPISEGKSCIRNILKEEVVPAICTSLEDTIWRVVEELKHASSQSAQLVRSSGKCLEKDEGRNLQLQFKTRLSLSVFTGQKVEGEQGVPIEVMLVNANTGNIVETGPESSYKLEVVVLEGGFRTEDDDNWTREEFEKYLVKEREGKRPLLTGNLEVILERGTGVLGEIEFTDNSSWTQSKKFRIGLQVSPHYCENIRVREATMESFAVKENRGELYKKHVPPASDDEVWRLKTIAKDGPFHKKLNEAGIYKVEEFLQKYYTDSEKLKNILGSGVTKKWEDLLNHAKICTLNGKFYVYYQDNKSDHGVILNNVGQLTGLTAHGVYCAADQISLQQKDHADRLVKKACENWNDVRQFDPEASSSSMSEKISCSFLSGVLGDQGCCHPVHDNMTLPRLVSQVGLRVPPESSAFTGEGMGSDWLRGKEKIAGNSGISPARLPELSESLYSQNAMWNQASDSLIQIEPSADTEVVIGQLDGSLLSFPSFGTLNFLPMMSISSPYGIVYPVSVEKWGIKLVFAVMMNVVWL